MWSSHKAVILLRGSVNALALGKKGERNKHLWCTHSVQRSGWEVSPMFFHWILICVWGKYCYHHLLYINNGALMWCKKMPRCHNLQLEVGIFYFKAHFPFQLCILSPWKLRCHLPPQRKLFQSSLLFSLGPLLKCYTGDITAPWLGRIFLSSVLSSVRSFSLGTKVNQMVPCFEGSSGDPCSIEPQSLCLNIAAMFLHFRG